MNIVLENKVAVLYGADGSIGGAVARTFAREGARVFLAGRTRAKLDRAATLADVGNVAAFVASDQARTMTATEVKFSCGALVD